MVEHYGLYVQDNTTKHGHNGSKHAGSISAGKPALGLEIHQTATKTVSVACQFNLRLIQRIRDHTWFLDFKRTEKSFLQLDFLIS